MIELCGGLRNAGALRAADAEIAALAVNVVMIATYWMSFQRLSRTPRRRPTTIRRAMQFERAIAQVLALLAPYLLGDHRALVEHLGARYLEDAARAGFDPIVAEGVNDGEKWTKFPHADAAYAYAGPALKKAWGRLHQGDREPFPKDAAVADALAAFPRRRIPGGGRTRACGRRRGHQRRRQGAVRLRELPRTRREDPARAVRGSRRMGRRATRCGTPRRECALPLRVRARPLRAGHLGRQGARAGIRRQDPRRADDGARARSHARGGRDGVRRLPGRGDRQGRRASSRADVRREKGFRARRSSSRR